MRCEVTRRCPCSTRSEPDARLHVIDPSPQFDPAEHEQRFQGQYVFHRDMSLRVLPTLEPVDIALIDGDHNWFTVYNEFACWTRGDGTLERAAPLFVLHDVSWPYGRRDGYSPPSRSPAGTGSPTRSSASSAETPVCSRKGGTNRNIWNAKREGGKRNGVLTALEDFLADHPSEYRHVVLDLYVGLAIVAPISRLPATPSSTASWIASTATAGREQLREQADEVVREGDRVRTFPAELRAQWN